jgi:hypothetical protein
VFRIPKKIINTIKALRQLGFRSMANYARYQIGLRTGFYKTTTPTKNAYTPYKISPPDNISIFIPSLNLLNSILNPADKEQGIKEADEIVQGNIRLFGGERVQLKLSLPGPLAHWTDYERGRESCPVDDIKYIWEPARFGWAFTLGRAYILSSDEKYAGAFWRLAEKFLEENPPNQGPNWMSAQEAALRLIAFAFSMRVFATSAESTVERLGLLAGAIAVHAERISPTITYAMAQNNNHLLTEAAGLFTAGCVLKSHPSSKKWRNSGWNWFNEGISNQVDNDGGYVQHSVNYHRLMLQTALWMHMLTRTSDQHENINFPEITRKKIARSVQWLYRIVDKETGQAPNLGPNDGAYIFPLTSLPFSDHRPVLQAASSAFMGVKLFEDGVWNEMMVWFNCCADRAGEQEQRNETGSDAAPHTLRAPRSSSWAYLRAAKFSSRPGHADQLHLDLWWQGKNIALDPGTYLYNAPHPWKNSLAHTEVHNTITIDGEDQMTHAGRFLWLDWAQSSVLSQKTEPGGSSSTIAEHTGYKRKGILHRREAAVYEDGSWVFTDHLLSSIPRRNKQQVHVFRLQWLLPDWSYTLDKVGVIERQPDGIFLYRLKILSPFGWIKITIEASKTHQNKAPSLLLARAGETLKGDSKAKPNWGWYSPTYARKIPALSLAITSRGAVPYRFITRWSFPDMNPAF